MSKVSKDFWVSDDFIKIMDESTRLVQESVTDWVFNYPIQKIYTGDDRSKHKITISYEIDREVTIRESDFEKILEKLHIANNELTERAIGRSLRYELFGGGENE